jgi:hypothetical protein
MVPWGVEHKVGLSFWNQSSCTLKEVLKGGTPVMLFLMKKSRSSAVAPTTAKFAPWVKLRSSPRIGGVKGSPNSSAAREAHLLMVGRPPHGKHHMLASFLICYRN